MLVVKALLAIGALAPVALAQTARQRAIQACANSIDMTSYESPVTYETTDETLFDANYTYNVTLCNLENPIPVQLPTLQNLDTGSSVSCTAVSFGTSGELYTQCSKSQGTMAREARGVDGADPAPNQSILLSLGRSPTFYTIRNDFVVEFIDNDPPPPGPSSRKRQLQRLLEPQFTCASDESYCWTGKGNDFACLATSNDVSACGACPYSDDVQDCSIIVGVDSVECKLAKCHVHSCMPGYQVSPDRSTCIKWNSHSARFWSR